MTTKKTKKKSLQKVPISDAHVLNPLSVIKDVRVAKQTDKPLQTWIQQRIVRVKDGFSYIGINIPIDKESVEKEVKKRVKKKVKNPFK